MRALRLLWLAAAIVCCGGYETVLADPLATAFTYQGQLKDGGVPANGHYDFLFRVYEAESGGSQVSGDVGVSAVLVEDGLFTVELDFDAFVFTGDARWLQVYVRDSDIGGEYIELSPRQPLNATPYALYALDGPGSSGYWGENGTAIYNTNSGRVGVGTNNPQFNLHVYDLLPAGDDQPPTTLGVHWAQALIPDPPSEWFYFAVGGTVLTAGSGTRMIRETGTELHFQTQDAMYSGWPATQMMLDADGRLGLGTSAPQEKLHVAGSGANMRLEHDTGDPGSYFLFRDTGITQGTIDKYTSSGNVILDINPMAADGTGSAALRLFRSTNTTGLKQVIFYRGNNTTSASAVIGMDGADSFFQIHGGNVGIGTSTPTMKLDVAGEARVEVLHITGADVAERFPVSETPDAIRPGTVMEIDPENPGQLRVARGAYNRRVAGVVSGAGDLPAGTILGNLPGSDDEPPIALSGRVWVRCDASDQAIEIGDLLTTAKAPGLAMAVRDFSRAHGTVIGKAMTPLTQGETGLVLVLVNLQ